MPILPQRCYNIALYHNSLAILWQHFVFAGVKLRIFLNITSLTFVKGESKNIQEALLPYKGDCIFWN